MNFHNQFEDFNKDLSELSPNIDSPNPVSSIELEVFECPFPGCGKIYRYKSEKDRHLVTHNTAKLYKCDYPLCTKSFKRPDALKVHMQSHSEEPQYICPVSICGHQFKDRPALKYHLSKHHSNELKLMRNSIEFQKALSNKKSPRQGRKSNQKKLQFGPEGILNQATPMVEDSSPENSYYRVDNSDHIEEDQFWEEDFISLEPRKILCSETEKRDVGLHDTVSTCSSESMKAKSACYNQENILDTDDIGLLKSAYRKLAWENQELKKELVNKMISFTERKISLDDSPKEFTLTKSSISDINHLFN